MRAAAGRLVGAIAWLWLRSLRLTLEVHPDVALEARPWVLALLHGKQWPVLARRLRRPMVVMVSLSADGQLQSRALATLGYEIVRGSSSRGGARGLAALVRRLKRGGADAAFAVDGPRGPYGVAKPGVVLAARAAGAVVVPTGSAMESGRVFGRAWDRYALAWPFSRVAVVLGAPLDPSVGPGLTPGAVEVAIAEANARAEALLAAPRTHMVPFARS